MDIKIKCTQQEFASLVRKCERVNSGYCAACSNCVLDELCRERGDQARIEHVVSVDLVEGGAAETEPIVQARWIDDNDSQDIAFGDYEPDCHCSACGKRSNRYHKRCPECGAHMYEGGAAHG